MDENFICNDVSFSAVSYRNVRTFSNQCEIFLRHNRIKFYLKFLYFVYLKAKIIKTNVTLTKEKNNQSIKRKSKNKVRDKLPLLLPLFVYLYSNRKVSDVLPPGSFMIFNRHIMSRTTFKTKILNISLLKPQEQLHDIHI